MPRDREPPMPAVAAALTGDDTSLVDLVDSLLGKGVVVNGEVVLGLAGVDLISLRLAALLAAADRVASAPAPSSVEPADGGALRRPIGDARPPRSLASGAAAVAASPVMPGGPTLIDLPDASERSAGGLHVARARPEAHLEHAERSEAAPRWNPDPEEVRRGVMKLVLALAEFIRQLLERQAIRRLDAGTLTDDEAERLGTALAELESTLRDMAARAGLEPEEINLDLGPLGTLV